FYVVAVHPNSPKNPHHAGAHGGTNIGNLNNPPETMHPLYGAVVGGPNINDSYDDSRTNIVQSEVALDYNSAFQGIMAYYVIKTYVSPTPSNPNEPINPNSISSLTQQQKIIIIVASLSFIIILLFISVIIARKYQGLEFYKGKIRKHPKDLEENNQNRKSIDDFEKDYQDTECETIKNSEQENLSSIDTVVDSSNDTVMDIE
ncbi:3203_t:CDS:2, partial [Dentiscutata heterogama]